MFDVDQLRLQIEGILRDNPDLDDETKLDTLDGATDIKAAMSWLYRLASGNRDMAEALDARIKKMDMRRNRLEVRVERFRALMLKVLQSADLKNIELPEATLSQRNGQPKIVGEVDPEKLPDDLVRIKREADRIAIREALLERRELPGLSLSNGPPTLAVNER